MTMEDQLASMTEKMLDLQLKYLDLQEHSSEEINRLHQRINQLSTTKSDKGMNKKYLSLRLIVCLSN